MPNSVMNNKKLITIVTTVEAVFVVLLVAAIYGMFQNHIDVIENRRIGCIGRYLDHQEYAPECDQYIKELKNGTH
jgi:uracil phosphoribosyltransferase